MADIPEEDRKRAKTFFDRGATVAGTGQFDYAIEMYLSGLNLDPEAVEAHQALRDISLRRKASGGKGLGMLDRMKIKTNTKDDKVNMLAAEKLLAFDPGNTDHMLSLALSAFGGTFHKTVLWIGPVLYRANTDSGKPDIAKFIKLKDIYRELQQWELAVSAAQAAVNMRPDDMDLNTELKHLGAQHTMTRGNYEKGGSFTQSVKDMDAQKKLLDADMNVQDVDVLTRQLNDAEAEWKAQPEEVGKISKYADALLKTESSENEQKAIDLLSLTFERTKQFRFRQAVGKIKLSQLKRRERSLREKYARNPTDEAVKEELATFIKNQIEEELHEYELWAEAYPTDLSFKYEVARRFSALGRHSEAIPVFQSARQDPKIRTPATIQLGRAFLEAEFVDEAVDTFRDLIDEYQAKGDERSKDMYYWYARSLEAHKDTQLALKAFSQVAQWDFNYKDVQARIKRLRAAVANPPAAG